jgi:hypothetical protein
MMPKSEDAKPDDARRDTPAGDTPGQDTRGQDTPGRPALPVEHRIDTSRDSLPGERDGLPPGALGGMPVEPQGDENRPPPPQAPTIPE